MTFPRDIRLVEFFTLGLLNSLEVSANTKNCDHPFHCCFYSFLSVYSRQTSTRLTTSFDDADDDNGPMIVKSGEEFSLVSFSHA